LAKTQRETPFGTSTVQGKKSINLRKIYTMYLINHSLLRLYKETAPVKSDKKSKKKRKKERKKKKKKKRHRSGGGSSSSDEDDGGDTVWSVVCLTLKVKFITF